MARVLRIQASDKIYDLGCPRNSCTSAGRAMALGDIVTFRKDKRWVYFESGPQGSSKERYRILKVIDERGSEGRNVAPVNVFSAQRETRQI